MDLIAGTLISILFYLIKEYILSMGFFTGIIFFMLIDGKFFHKIQNKKLKR